MKSKKILSMILVVSLVICAFPFAAVAEDSVDEYYSEFSDVTRIIDENPEVENELNSKIGCGITEIESLREENVKHYQLADGTYQAFSYGKLGNYMQIDNDDSSNNYCTNDAILELFDLNGDIYQRWNITYLHNGYYKIVSAKSGKAVSVKSGKENTGEQALRQQTYIADSRQQWKITSAHNGQYKIKPRSSESYSTDWVMAAGNGIGTNGRNVEQRKYVNNTSYLDEWILLKPEDPACGIFINYKVPSKTFKAIPHNSGGADAPSDFSSDNTK